MLSAVVDNVDLWDRNYSASATVAWGARLLARATHVAQPASASLGLQVVPQEEFSDARRDLGWLYVTRLLLPNGEQEACDKFAPPSRGGTWRWAVEVIRQGSHIADLFASHCYIPLRITCMVVDDHGTARPFTLARHTDVAEIARIWRQLLVVLDMLSLRDVDCDMSQLLRIKDALSPAPVTPIVPHPGPVPDPEKEQLKAKLEKLQRDLDDALAVAAQQQREPSSQELRDAAKSLPSDRLKTVLDATNELDKRSDLDALRELRTQLLGNKRAAVSAQLTLTENEDAPLRTLLAAAVGQRLAVLTEHRVRQQTTLSGVWTAMRDLDRASSVGVEIDATRHFLLRGVLERQAYECAQRELLGVEYDADVLWGMRKAWFAEATLDDPVLRWRLKHLLPFLDKALFRAFIGFTGSCTDLEKLRMWRTVVAEHKYDSPVDAFELVEPHALVLIDAAITRLLPQLLPPPPDPLPQPDPHPSDPDSGDAGSGGDSNGGQGGGGGGESGQSALSKALAQRRPKAPENPHADIALVTPSKLETKQVDSAIVTALLSGRASSLSDKHEQSADDDSDAAAWDDRNVRAPFPKRSWCALLTDDSVCADEWRVCRAPLVAAAASGDYVKWFGLAMFRPDRAISAESLVGGALVGMRKSGDMDVVALGALDRLVGVSVMLAVLAVAPALRESTSKEAVNAFRASDVAAFSVRLYVGGRDNDAGAAAIYAASERALMKKMTGGDTAWMCRFVEAPVTTRFVLRNEMAQRRWRCRATRRK